jgi:2-polyprenyl-3-methyl-5-hydroxy-6-metoxy-1,4-benzoquinol methylase
MKLVTSLMQLAVRTFFKVLFLFSREEKHSLALEKTVELYRGEGFGELFSKIRAWDAPYGPIDKLISPRAKVLDLGCGDGLLANFLAISAKGRRVYGIELSADRVVKANKKIKNTNFKKGDILKTKIDGSYDVITLIHVLHHLPSKVDQERLLQKISNSLKKNKELIILEIDTKPLLKYFFTWLTDVVTVPILFEKRLFNFEIYYRKKSDWVSLLRKLGFSVKARPLHKGMPFSHILIHAKKN